MLTICGMSLLQVKHFSKYGLPDDSDDDDDVDMLPNQPPVARQPSELLAQQQQLTATKAVGQQVSSTVCDLLFVADSSGWNCNRLHWSSLSCFTCVLVALKRRQLLMWQS